MLTGRERATPSTYCYPEYEGKKTSTQAYVREVIKRQQELNELCRRNSAQAQMRQRWKYDEKILQAKLYTVERCLGVSECHPSKSNKEVIEEMERTIHDNKGKPAGSVLSLEHRTCNAL